MNVIRLARKVKSMPAAEVAGRTLYQLGRLTERIQHRTVGLAAASRLHRALRPSATAGENWRHTLLESRRRYRPAFYPGAEARDLMREQFASTYAGQRSASIVWADRALRHEVSFFGAAFNLGERIAWHHDPVSGRRWPRDFYQSISAADSAGAPDIKYVWELSRHQFVLDLAKAYFLTGNPEYATHARELVLDWQAANPYGIGVNWASPLEPAYRALSWLWAYWLTIDDPTFDPESHARWIEAFYDAGRFLHQHLELYSSPYNHLLGEACALYAIGTAFPEFTESSRWRRRGRDVLINRLPFQFYPDGGSVEQATCYHHASLGFYLLAALLGRANGDPFPEAVWRAIKRGIEFSVAMMQPDGRHPTIGDTDDARPICFERRDLWDYRAFAAVGAVLFDRPDFKCAAGTFPEDALWLLGPRGFETFTALAAAPAAGSVQLAASGYVVMRSDRSSEADFVCFDCGEQAGGLRHDEVANAAHGHADCLSVIVWLGGRPVLVDAGFFTYNSDRKWERFFRETAAHNTIRVDRQDQARHLEKMAWSHAPRATLHSWWCTADQGAAVGSHDGFQRMEHGILHWRAVWLRSGGYVVIRDELRGLGAHHAELNYQLAPMTGTLANGAFLAEGEFEVRVRSDRELAATVACGGPEPQDGWVARSLGLRQAAPRLTFAGPFQAPGLVALTVVADLKRVALFDVPGNSLSIVVAAKSFTDVVTATNLRATDVSAGVAASADAAVVIGRLQNGAVDVQSIGGKTIPFDGERIKRVAESVVDLAGKH